MTPDESPHCITEVREDQGFTQSGDPHTGTLYHRRFNSFVDYVEFADQDPNPGRLSKRSSHDTDRPRFHYFDTWGDAVEAAREGWTEGRKKVLDVIDSVDPDGIDMQGERTTVTYESHGQRLAMGRYQAGDPECWANRTTVSDDHAQGTESVKINVNIAFSASVPKDAIIQRGAAVAALAEVLEWVGIATEIVATECSGPIHGGDGLCHEITVKRDGEPLNPDVLAFQLGNPDMLRRLNFAAIEAESKHVQDNVLKGGYGCPYDWDEHKGDGELYVPSMHGSDTDWGDSGKAEDFVNQMLEDLGITDSQY